MNVEAVGTLSAALVGATTGMLALYRARADKRKTDAETTGTVVTTAVDMAERLTNVASGLVTPMQLQLDSARSEVASLRERFAVLEATADRLEQAEQACIEREGKLQIEIDRLTALMGGRRKDDR